MGSASKILILAVFVFTWANADEVPPQVQLFNPYLPLEQIRADLPPETDVQFSESVQAKLLEIDWLKPHVQGLDAVDRDLFLMRVQKLPLQTLMQRYPTIPQSVLLRLQKSLGSHSS